MKQLYKDLSPDKTMDILNLFFSNLELEFKLIQEIFLIHIPYF